MKNRFVTVVSTLVALHIFVAGCEMFEEEPADSGPVQSTLVWVPIEAGKFDMGDALLMNASPVHRVYVPPFEMKRTEVTVAEYAQCVAAGACAIPEGDYGYCNWDNQMESADHPVNCVRWQQAVDFCAWFGGRLPSEAEWEYAARSAGKDRAYPWGKDRPSCDFAVMADKSGIHGCGTKRTWPVCSKPEGNTEHGLCDMAGNVFEWVEDHFHLTYAGSPPADGSAWIDPGGIYRVLRGAAYNADQDHFLDVASRGNSEPDMARDFIGFRCAR